MRLAPRSPAGNALWDFGVFISMLNLLQISDLHFGPLYLPDVGEALLRAAADIQADVIVASGDFTQAPSRPNSPLPERFSTDCRRFR